MKFLGIETSCDETSAAVVRADGVILSNVVLSQLEEHRVFGGVVPEVAARAHIDHLHAVIRAAMEDSNTTFDALQGVCATCGPGLIGGVMVGMVAAKAIAASRYIPFLAVNHLEGHALTPRLTDKIAFPYLLLLVSGGHTQILLVKDVGAYECWGTTRDDAAGECFDKSAKLMGLPYPGGPQIQKLAEECEDPVRASARFPLPAPMKGRSGHDFSFSGLKTAVRHSVEKLPAGVLHRSDIADLACAFQNTMADVMEDRCTLALDRFLEKGLTQTPVLVVAGGVSANQMIRSRLKTLCQQKQVRFYAPPLALCGDNAAMIAWAGIERFQKGIRDSLDFKARPRWPLDDRVIAGHGL